jgi:hypothetical protein
VATLVDGGWGLVDADQCGVGVDPLVVAEVDVERGETKTAQPCLDLLFRDGNIKLIKRKVQV